MAMNKDTAKIIPFGASARACERARHESTKDAILLLEGVKTAEFGGGWYHEYGHLHKNGLSPFVRTPPGHLQKDIVAS